MAGDDEDQDGSEAGGSVFGVWADTSAPPSSSDEHPFAIADAERYDRGGLLGKGGMGEVYAARDRRLNREVAFKLVSAGAGSSGRDRLAQEAWITAQQEHPGRHGRCDRLPAEPRSPHQPDDTTYSPDFWRTLPPSCA